MARANTAELPFLRHARHQDGVAADGFEVLNVDEAAALLRVNSKTLREAIARGEVPGVRRIGRVIRLSRAALLDWLRGKPAT